jgi:BirA family biotin operon repressor/biotin-[acetyl-CoA-carboxylase] ligase
MFNLENFDLKLDTEYIGRNFYYIQEIDSTNDFLLKSGEIKNHGSVVLAENQTKGKGRNGRTWTTVSDKNLTFSVLLNEDLQKINISLLNFAASLSVGNAFENLFQLDVNLKWPNDVLIKQKKIAGILTETVSKSNKIEKAVIGIGINVNQPTFPEKFLIPPTSCRIELKREVSRERLLSETLNILEENLTLLRYNPKELLDSWRNKCKMIGGKVKITQDKEVIVGKFIDIDENGYLILLRNKVEEKIHYGDVVSLREQ